ncbi:hypothetical protein OTERR_00670 [Oryzomicrobium terrae]|uniref:Uncharacterized protein n=1 Tax=Oryzomicrobium terrae TaxID=1735038 RepID=A0A5C1E3W8_9RHOO|nr:TorF family putative porin [Oryzomicrobium terrae]QEL63543.1 hypothetical protein OTERR_00670 [Oryzomicrobium terrae]
MRKTLLAIAVASLGLSALPAFAQSAAPEASAEPASPHTLTANVGLFSSYRFRGIDQTYGQPALQGGFDYSHASGFYVGNWNSNVASGAGFPGGNLEMDFYGGWKQTFGDFGVDLGALLYYYPGSGKGPLVGKTGGETVTNKELYVAGSWKFVTLKYSYAIDDYFAAKGINASGAATGRSTAGTSYLDLSANYDLGDGWGVNAHVGQLYFKNVHNGDYTDWKVGVTKDLSGWVVGASYVGTNAKGSCSGVGVNPYCFAKSIDTDGNVSSSKHNAGKGIAVLSVSRTF